MGRRAGADVRGGGGIRLRPWRDEDIEAWSHGTSPTTTCRPGACSTPTPSPEWLLVRREQMSLGKVLSWCVAETSTDAALGEVLVFVTEGTLDDDTAELGYQVVPSGRGRGVATAGSAAWSRHALRAAVRGGLGMRRLVAQTAEDNAASNAVLDRLGFTIWGRETAADILPDGRESTPCTGSFSASDLGVTNSCRMPDRSSGCRLLQTHGESAPVPEPARRGPARWQQAQLSSSSRRSAPPLAGLPGAPRTSSTPAARSALRSTRATRSSPRRNGST